MTGTKTQNRQEVLKALIELSAPLEKLTASVTSIGWDPDSNNLVELNRSHILKILNRYLSSELSEQEIEQWANLLEGREDIRFEYKNDQWIRQVIHELANPLLTKPLNRERAAKLIFNSK